MHVQLNPTNTIAASIVLHGSQLLICSVHTGLVLCCLCNYFAVSVTGNSGVGLPVILLHDAEGSVCTVEVKSGDVYRGILDEAEDNMNIMMKDILRTDIRGKTSTIKKLYIRGSQIVLVIVPDMLRKAAMFKRIVLWRKHKGNPPSFAASANTGQRAAILRKAAERTQQAGR
jgi:small nuclear ribonucleoprotein D3